jgi:hypothetical protein
MARKKRKKHVLEPLREDSMAAPGNEALAAARESCSSCAGCIFMRLFLAGQCINVKSPCLKYET